MYAIRSYYDDIDVVRNSQSHKTIFDFIGIFGQFPNCLRLCKMIVIGHQRSIKKLGKQNKVAFITGNCIDKIFDLGEELINIFVKPHLPFVITSYSIHYTKLYETKFTTSFAET